VVIVGIMLVAGFVSWLVSLFKKRKAAKKDMKNKKD
jgi:hypothetical protein